MGTALYIIRYSENENKIEYKIGTKVVMKKQHPCGNKEFIVLRVGMDFKLKCAKCGHEIMITRQKAEKGIIKIIRE